MKPLTEIWKFRDLFYILIWRDILVRYKQTLFGVLWAVARPLITIIIFSFVFQRVANIPTHGDYPYQLTVFAAMLPWMLFSHLISDGGNSLLANVNLVTKVYFPRIYLPLACLGVGLIDYFINTLLFAIIIFALDVNIEIGSVIGLLFAVIPTIFLSLGSVLYISAATARYRDFKFMVPFILQVGIYVTPVGYELSALGVENARYLELNPLTFCVEISRYLIIDGYPLPSVRSFISYTLFGSVTLVVGLFYFNKTSKTMADYI